MFLTLLPSFLSHTMILLSSSPLFVSHVYSISVCITQTEMGDTFFLLATINTFFLVFQSLPHSLYSFGVFHNPVHPDLIQFLSLFLIPLYKQTQLSVCRAQLSCEKWIVEGQF